MSGPTGISIQKQEVLIKEMILYQHKDKLYCGHLILNRHREMVSTRKKWKRHLVHTLFGIHLVLKWYRSWTSTKEMMQFTYTSASIPLYQHLIFAYVITIKYKAAFNLFQPNMSQLLVIFRGFYRTYDVSNVYNQHLSPTFLPKKIKNIQYLK